MNTVDEFVNSNMKAFRKDCVTVIQAMIDFSDEHKLTTESDFRGMLHNFKDAYENPVMDESKMTSERYHTEASADHFTSEKF